MIFKTCRLICACRPARCCVRLNISSLEITLNITASLSKKGYENLLALSRTKIHTSRKDIFRNFRIIVPVLVRYFTVFCERYNADLHTSQRSKFSRNLDATINTARNAVQFDSPVRTFRIKSFPLSSR